jgi:hypothetical protein
MKTKTKARTKFSVGDTVTTLRDVSVRLCGVQPLTLIPGTVWTVAEVVEYKPGQFGYVLTAGPGIRKTLAERLLVKA